MVWDFRTSLAGYSHLVRKLFPLPFTIFQKFVKKKAPLATGERGFLETRSATRLNGCSSLPTISRILKVTNAVMPHSDFGDTVPHAVNNARIILKIKIVK